MGDRLEKIKNGYIDFISAIALLVFSIFIFAYGIYILNTMNLGKGVEWYTSPALMPLFIGIVISILSFLLAFKNRKSFVEYLKSKKEITKEGVKKINLKEILLHYKDNQFLRFIITLILLVLYIFVFIGRLPFIIATFIYLVSNMIIFRENGFAIWKLVIISLAMSIIINYGFGFIAKIPLP